MNGSTERGGCQEGREKKELFSTLTLTMIPTMLTPCPASGGVLSFKQRKKVPKEAPQGTNGSLTSLRGRRAEKTGLVSATRTGLPIFPWKNVALTFL